MLAIGLVVDDAIVVLENIYRHMEMGKSRMQAAIDGSNEIGFAVVATTIALVAVFVPLAFLTGSVGRLFNEFGVSLAVAVLISGFVALTLTPMLCSKILKPLHGTGTGWASRSFDRFFEKLNRVYEKTLRGALARRGLMVATAVLDVGAQRRPVLFPPERTGPHRGPGHRFRDRHRAGGRDARLHRQVHAGGGADGSWPFRSGVRCSPRSDWASAARET